jgi:hypothetical protein
MPVHHPENHFMSCRRQAILYGTFSLALFFCLLLLAGAFLSWPAAVKVCTGLLLTLFTVCFILIVAFTAVLKVGADGCINMEAKLEEAFDDPAALDILRYYLYGEGSDVQTVLQESLGFNVDSALDQVTEARQELVDNVLETYQLRPLLAGLVDAAIAASYGVEQGINDLLNSVDYDQVNPIYMGAKQYPCCRVLDFVGGVWTGLIIVGSFVFVSCILSCVLIGWFDATPGQQQGYCGCLKQGNGERVAGKEGDAEVVGRRATIEILADSSEAHVTAPPTSTTPGTSTR